MLAAPPTVPPFSKTMTLASFWAAAVAAERPDMPPPITIKSASILLILDTPFSKHIILLINP
jgi:hypothetical protein